MKAIVDCNSFYCSCERVFRPELDTKPVVVLSNNDGCIISRSDEAKQLGVGMAGPYFLAKDIIEKNGVEVFSSNYNLYGNMSWRVMQTLRDLVGVENVEVYSVDEAFIDLENLGGTGLDELALQIRHKVEQWTGVAVSVGVAPTKTLAKLANNMAKKNKFVTRCVTVLDSPEKIAAALRQAKVKDLWGVGRKLAEKLNGYNIFSAWELYSMSEDWVRKFMGGVVGVRLHRELHGEEAIIMEDELTSKKMIATTRMFGAPVDSLSDISEAIATYTSRAAEKLRRQHSAATVISVFVVEKKKSPSAETEVEIDPDKKRSSWGAHNGDTLSASTVLLRPTLLTQELIKPAVEMAGTLFRKGRAYKKAGVILSGLVPDTAIQTNLFETPGKNIDRVLMDMMDNINFSMRDDVLKFASSGTRRNWKMRQEFHSPRYTTRWEELCEVK